MKFHFLTIKILFKMKKILLVLCLALLGSMIFTNCTSSNTKSDKTEQNDNMNEEEVEFEDNDNDESIENELDSLENDSMIIEENGE